MAKFFTVNSVRGRMVSGFLFLTFLLLVLAVVSIVIFDILTRASAKHSNISQAEIYTLSLLKNDNDFFDLETINENYFDTHKSDFLTQRDSLNALIEKEIRTILRDAERGRFSSAESLLEIDSTLNTYNRKFDQLEALVFRKGFKDYGVEGAMRYHAHELEELIDNSDRIKLLSLRRHEKDFLLRSDTAYLTSFRNVAAEFRKSIVDKRGKTSDLVFHLSEYYRLFMELASIQQQLGLSSKHGLRNELNILTYSLTNQYYSLSENAYRYTRGFFNSMRTFYIILLTGGIAFSLIAGYWISRRIAEPITYLSRIIKNATASRNTLKTDLSNIHAASEIKTLSQSFNVLMDEVNIQMQTVELKNQELEKTNRELDNFLYSTAHDLRSPLTSLLGLLNLIRTENTQQHLLPYFDYMEKSIVRSENFISQIVSYSKNKKLDLKPELLDLHALISGILESHQFMMGFEKIVKHINIQEDTPFYSDRNRITMILTNLISNGIKYADLEKSEPYIRISIQVRQSEAEIEFSDNGVGIESNHIAKIFDMFYRANINSTGSGLGLFIFRETLTRIGGHATVDSILGAGTKFFVRIPNLAQSVPQQNLELQ